MTVKPFEQDDAGIHPIHGALRGAVLGCHRLAPGVNHSPLVERAAEEEANQWFRRSVIGYPVRRRYTAVEEHLIELKPHRVGVVWRFSLGNTGPVAGSRAEYFAEIGPASRPVALRSHPQPPAP